jgi:hypothetical protein
VVGVFLIFGCIAVVIGAFILLSYWMPRVGEFLCTCVGVVFLGGLLYATISGIVENRIAIRAWWRLYFWKPKALGPRTCEERKRREHGWRKSYALVILLAGGSLLVALIEYVMMIMLVGVVALIVGLFLSAGILGIRERLRRRK